MRCSARRQLRNPLGADRPLYSRSRSNSRILRSKSSRDSHRISASRRIIASPSNTSSVSPTYDANISHVSSGATHVMPQLVMVSTGWLHCTHRNPRMRRRDARESARMMRSSAGVGSAAASLQPFGTEHCVGADDENGARRRNRNCSSTSRGTSMHNNSSAASRPKTSCRDVRLCASRQRAKVSARLRSNATLVDSKWILSDCSSNRDFFVLMQAPYQNTPARREHFDKC